jgi:hypothetical protein
MTYALLGLIALVLLTGLVAFGVGHQRWSWGTLIAAILVLLTATGYLYLASRFAAYESKQVEAVGRKQIELAKVRDALMPDPSNGGRLRPIAGDGPESKSIAALTEEQERWRRVLDRIDTWRDRSWTKASFDPPKADGETGEIRIPFAAEAPRPAEGADVAAPATPAAAPDTPPLDPGATVYVFDDTAAQEGGHYLGAFRVQSSTVDAASGQSVLAILQTAARDDYDKRVWDQSYDSVTVYESLPPDRWTGFSKPRQETEAGQGVPDPGQLSLDEIEKMLDERDRQRASLDQAEPEKATIEKDEWDQIRKRLDDGIELAGRYWAVVKFKEATTVAEAGEDEQAPLTFEPDAVAEFDLQTASALADGGKATIEEVYRRRALSDAGTQIHGSSISRPSGADNTLIVDGVAALAAVLKREIGSLEASAKRLEESKADIDAEMKATNARGDRLAADKKSWDRDAAEATRMADSFAKAVAESRGQLAATEQAILALGAELRTSVGRLVERIDAVAPAPGRPPAAGTP